MGTIIGRLSQAGILVAAAGLVLGACATPVNGSGTAQPVSAPISGAASRATTTPGAPVATSPNGIVAKGESPDELFEARSIRLVRTGTNEVAAQFELYNGSNAASSPSRWIDPKSRQLLLLDLPHGTSYQPLGETKDAGYKGTWGRLSGNWTDPVESHQSITLTAVFAAPPAESTTLVLAMGDLLPVQVPVQPAGSSTLTSDPILTDTHLSTSSGPLVCATTHPSGPTEFRLPADVLFAFDSADLSPDASTAIDSLVKQVDGTAGTVRVEGNTDSLGADAYNQTLSEHRAAAVATLLQGKLGGGFTFTTVGLGKTKPVAPNANPDGSDNPDGRQQNRRVDIAVTTANPEQPAPAAAAPAAAPANLKAAVVDVQRSGGFLLTSLTISNSSSTPANLGYSNQVSAEAAKGGLFPGELAVQDAAAAHYSLCIPGGPANFSYSYAASMHSYPTVPANGSITLWGVTPAPAADTVDVSIQIGGFPQPVQGHIGQS